MSAVSLLWRSSAWRFLAIALLLGASGALPVFFLVLMGRVVQDVARLAGSHRWPLPGYVGRDLTLLAVAYVLQTVVAILRATLAGALGYRASLRLRDEVIDATFQSQGIAHLETPEVADELQFVGSDEQRFYTDSLSTNLSQVVAAKLSGFGSALLLARFAWWAPMIPLLPIAMGYRWIVREVKVMMTSLESTTYGLRRASYLRDLAVRREAAKEARIFGLGEWLVSHFSATWREAMAPVWRLRRGNRTSLVLYSLTEFCCSAALYGLLAHSALARTISVGSLATLAGAAQGVRSLGHGGDQEFNLRRGAETVARFRGLHGRLKRYVRPIDGSDFVTVVGDIQFKRVSFAYPGAGRRAIDGLTLNVTAGESLAIVGHNGAGKTTLAKLVARLYDPDEGEITFGGVDIRTFDPDEWRRRIAVIFQDFIRFELSARKNVGFGAVDIELSDAILDSVGGQSGVSDVIEKLPGGWDTILAPGYVGGVDLSGGQWQRIALARALMALRGGADILILDEPTANLDPKAEAELFERFLEVSAGITTILISHRFSTVRRADRIAVLDRGSLVELGTHSELMRFGGLYARLFELQASRFLDESHGS